MSRSIAITGSGMVTPLGNDSPSSCAAIHCGIDNFQETQFKDSAGEKIIASLCELDERWSGETRLVNMAAAAVAECLDCNPAIDCKQTPLILCLPESNRPGRLIADDEAFFIAVQKQLGQTFSKKSRIQTHGHVAVAVALLNARQMLSGDTTLGHVLIASADSLVTELTLSALEDNDRLLTSQQSDGFIPGEAGVAIVVERARGKSGAMSVHGMGFAVEPAPILSGLPTRAEGLTQAIKTALKEAQIPIQEMACRITDLTGEHYHFREAALALSRTLRVRRDEFDIMHPADCVGDTGTTLGLVMLAYQMHVFSCQPPCLPQILAHFGDDDGKRAAMVLGIN